MIHISLDYIAADRNGKIILAGLNDADGHDLDPYAPWLDGKGDTSDGLIFFNEALTQTRTCTSQPFLAILEKAARRAAFL